MLLLKCTLGHLIYNEVFMVFHMVNRKKEHLEHRLLTYSAFCIF